MGGKPSVTKILKRILKRTLKLAEEKLNDPEYFFDAKEAARKANEGDAGALDEFKKKIYEGINREQKPNLIKLWELCDTNGNGFLDPDEARVLLDAYTDVLVLFVRNEGQLRKLIMQVMMRQLPPETLAAREHAVALKKVAKELPQILTQLYLRNFKTPEFRDAVMKGMDQNRDGKVDKKEFISAFLSTVNATQNDTIRTQVQDAVMEALLKEFAEVLNMDNDSSDDSSDTGDELFRNNDRTSNGGGGDGVERAERALEVRSRQIEAKARRIVNGDDEAEEVKNNKNQAGEGGENKIAGSSEGRSGFRAFSGPGRRLGDGPYSEDSEHADTSFGGQGNVQSSAGGTWK